MKNNNITFVAQQILAIQKIIKAAKIKDKETKKSIKFLLKVCKAAKKHEVSKKYGIRQPYEVKIFNVNNKHTG